jgi:hypothetical protein
MKEVKILLIFVLIFASKLYAQEQKSAWKLNILMSHYDREKENELNLGDNGYKINPGLEVLYCYPLKTRFHLSTGLSYQYVDLISHIEASDRFELGELSIPLLMTVNNKSGYWSFSTGVYSGRFLHFSWDQNLHGNWVSVTPDERESYLKQNFFMDAYFDFAYSNSSWLKNGNAVKIAPFVRFRFKENWMDHYRTSVYYGIKLGVDLRKN